MSNLGPMCAMPAQACSSPASPPGEERFRQVLEAAPDAILEIDSQGRITLANAAAEKIFGYPRTALIGQPVEMLVPEVLRSAHASHRASYDANPKVRPMGAGLELNALRNDRTVIPVEISLSPHRQGKDLSVIAIVRDVSERKQIEELLRRSEEKLRRAEKLEALGRLAGGVAHEFNNLLMVVLGYSELLLPLVAENDQPRDYVEKISVAARRAAAITQQLLAFGRRQLLVPRVLDLNHLVVESCHIISRLLGETIETIALPLLDPAWVKVDPTQIDQIMAIMATNARSAMPDGGKLTVVISRIEVNAENIRQYAELLPGQYVVLTVSDTGTGMLPEIESRLFEPFFSTHEVGQGTGMGLASMYGVVNQSGGSITVTSQPGVGTSFQIYLPAAVYEGPPDMPKVPLESLRGHGTILLVEDQIPLLELTREFLSRLGYRVLATAFPEEALEISRRLPGPIDLLLTDVVMPGMNGHELAQRLHPERPEMKILYVSGFADQIIAHSAASGPTDPPLLEKPYALEDLGRMAHQLLEVTAPAEPA